MNTPIRLYRNYNNRTILASNNYQFYFSCRCLQIKSFTQRSTMMTHTNTGYIASQIKIGFVVYFHLYLQACYFTDWHREARAERSPDDGDRVEKFGSATVTRLGALRYTRAWSVLLYSILTQSFVLILPTVLFFFIKSLTFCCSDADFRNADCWCLHTDSGVKLRSLLFVCIAMHGHVLLGYRCIPLYMYTGLFISVAFISWRPGL